MIAANQQRKCKECAMSINWNFHPTKGAQSKDEGTWKGTVRKQTPVTISPIARKKLTPKERSEAQDQAAQAIAELLTHQDIRSGDPIQIRYTVTTSPFDITIDCEVEVLGPLLSREADNRRWYGRKIRSSGRSVEQAISNLDARMRQILDKEKAVGAPLVRSKIENLEGAAGSRDVRAMYFWFDRAGKADVGSTDSFESEAAKEESDQTEAVDQSDEEEGPEDNYVSHVAIIFLSLGALVVFALLLFALLK